MKYKFKKFRNWGISSKIIGVAFSSALMVALVVFFYLLPVMEDTMKEDRISSVKQVVETAGSVLQEYSDMVSKNEISLNDAQKQAIEKIKGLRYSGNEYFWINDLGPKMIMHPFKPDLDGKDLSDNTDPNGIHLFKEMVNVCKEKGEGFVEYMWPKPGHDQPQPKISYVKLFKDWGWILGSGVYADDIDDAVASLQTKVTLSLIAVFTLAALIGMLLGRYIAKPIKKLTEASNRIASGETEVEIKSSTEDEIGKLENSLSLMVANIKEQAKAAENIAEGNLNIKINVRSEKDYLNKSMQLMVDTLQKLQSELSSLTRYALDGKLSERGNTGYFSGGYKEIIEGINKTLDAVILPIQDGNKVLAQMATGDFTVRVKTEYKGDHQALKNSINLLGQSLSELISNVSEAVNSTASASTEISSSTEQMAASAQEQSAQTSEVAAAIEQMTQTILETSKNTSAAAQNAKTAGQIAEEGGRVVDETVKGMERIADVVCKASETVKQLGNSSDEIGEIIQVIDDIADQTNLLALNAAIEAARAGEMGRGFAVVADEVRKLAERTTKATKEIATMIKQIQKDTGDAVVKIEEGTGEVEKGRELAAKAGNSLQQIIKASVKVVDDINQVASAGEEQSATAEQISKNIESINNVSQENSTGIQQVATAAEDLNRLTQNLENLLSKFRISKDSGYQESTLAVRSNGKLVPR